MAHTDPDPDHDDDESSDLNLEAHVDEELVRDGGSYSLGVLRNVRQNVGRHRFETPRGKRIPRSEDNIKRVLKTGGEWQAPSDAYSDDEDA